MEEKVLVKGEFGGKFFPVIFYILAALAFGILTIVDIVDYWDGILIATGAGSAVVLVVCGIIIAKTLKMRELIVTTKRVIARGAFGYRTDLKIENITDVTTGFAKCISCASASARVKFHFCKNKMEMFDAVAAQMLKKEDTSI